MSLSLTWLGQSGFIVRAPETAIACDLYLSDYCQKLNSFDHTRQTPIAVPPEKLNGVNYYLITHNHSDHFDPETIEPVAKANPKTVFICPPSCRVKIDKHFPGLASRFKFIQSRKEYEITEDVRLFALPAAHEELEIDDTGEYVSFSYLLLFDDFRKAVFFAGDTIPYEEQAETITKHVPAGYGLVMALPVNGRDSERAALGVKGNLTLEEAVELYHECNAGLFVPCHFGMFEFNDVKQPLNPGFFTKNKVNAVIPELNEKINLEEIK